MIFSGEHLLLLLIVLLFFGPRLLPAVGQTLGKTVRNLKDGLSGTRESTYRKLGETVLPADEEHPS